MHLPFPVLAADIGGTNARFAIVEPDGSYLSLGRVNNSDHASPQAAVRFALKDYQGEPPKSAAMAIACPINGETFQLTNAAWELQPKAFLKDSGFSHLAVMNDFMAQGLAAIALDRTHLKQIGGMPADEDAPRVIIGPGTGLGVAIAVKADKKWIIVPGEGGHVDLGPRTDRETAIWPHLNKREGRMEAEMAISGPGLENLHQAIVCEAGGTGGKRAATISAAAIEGSDPQCVEAVGLMTQFLARLCGDLAVTTMARGGIYLAGGVTRHVLPFLEKPQFRNAFEDKHPFRDIMAEIPIFAMLHNEPAIAGIAGLVSRPDTFQTGNAVIGFGK